jgi:hypothetical protein
LLFLSGVHTPPVSNLLQLAEGARITVAGINALVNRNRGWYAGGRGGIRRNAQGHGGRVEPPPLRRLRRFQISDMRFEIGETATAIATVDGKVEFWRLFSGALRGRAQRAAALRGQLTPVVASAKAHPSAARLFPER